MELREVPDPVPGDGEVLVDVEAVGVNFRDVYERTREGYGVDPPAVIGAEAGGTTPDGERLVWSAVPHSYAEKVVVPRARPVAIPEGVGTDVAVAVLLQGMTRSLLGARLVSDPAGRPRAGARGRRRCRAAADPDREAPRCARDRDRVADEKRALAREVGRRRAMSYEALVEHARELNAAAVYDGIGKTTFAQASTRSRRPAG